MNCPSCGCEIVDQWMGCECTTPRCNAMHIHTNYKRPSMVPTLFLYGLFVLGILKLASCLIDPVR